MHLLGHYFEMNGAMREPGLAWSRGGVPGETDDHWFQRGRLEMGYIMQWAALEPGLDPCV